MLTLIDHQVPIHNHVLDSDRVLVGRLKCRAISHQFRIKDRDVGIKLFLKETPLLKTQALRRRSTHLAHRLFKR
jgi:hypothetical protein